MGKVKNGIKCDCHRGREPDYGLVCVCLLSHFSRVPLYVTPWTVSRQALLFLDSPGKNTGVGCHALLQGIFQTQGSNLQLTPASPELQADSLLLSHLGSPSGLVGRGKEVEFIYLGCQGKEI